MSHIHAIVDVVLLSDASVHACLDERSDRLKINLTISLTDTCQYEILTTDQRVIEQTRQPTRGN